MGRTAPRSTLQLRPKDELLRNHFQCKCGTLRAALRCFLSADRVPPPRQEINNHNRRAHLQPGREQLTRLHSPPDATTARQSEMKRAANSFVAPRYRERAPKSACPLIRARAKICQSNE